MDAHSIEVPVVIAVVIPSPLESRRESNIYAVNPFPVQGSFEKLMAGQFAPFEASHQRIEFCDQFERSHQGALGGCPLKADSCPSDKTRRATWASALPKKTDGEIFMTRIPLWTSTSDRHKAKKPMPAGSSETSVSTLQSDAPSVRRLWKL
jgi:hypothetical protein